MFAIRDFSLRRGCFDHFFLRGADTMTWGRHDQVFRHATARERGSMGQRTTFAGQRYRRKHEDG